MNKMDNLYENLLVELECSVCTNYMAPPIYQCVTGHSICNTCKNKLKNCPLCQGFYTNSRNISLEALATKIYYPCVNQATGCDVKPSLKDREEHERSCSFRGFTCAMNKCSWVGKREDILAHWSSKKNMTKIYGVSNICHSKIKSESFYVNLVEAYNNFFWFKCRTEKGKIFWAVQLIGHVEEAADYCYEIELFKPGSSYPKISFRDYCSSVEINDKNLFDGKFCPSASIDTLQKFLGDDQLLIYYMRVNKADSSDGAQSRRNHRKNLHEHKSRSQVNLASNRGKGQHFRNHSQQKGEK